MIIITNGDHKYFVWCHIRYLNPLDTHPGRIKTVNWQMVNGLDYGDIKFPYIKNVTD